MSTKIYDAYRVPIEGLNDFLEATRTNVWNDFLERTKGLVYGLKESYVEKHKKEDRWKGYDFSTEYADLRLRWEIVKQGYREAAVVSRKGMYDAGWNVWLHSDGYAYLIYWGKGYKHGALELAEFFGYWDNADPPEGLSYEEFEERGAVWEEVCLNDWNSPRLYHSLIDFLPNTYHAIYQVEKYLGLIR